MAHQHQQYRADNYFAHSRSLADAATTQPRSPVTEVSSSVFERWQPVRAGMTHLCRDNLPKYALCLSISTETGLMPIAASGACFEL